MFDLAVYMDSQTRLVNEALDAFLPKASERPSGLHEAMRYSLFAGGKRLRPVLCLASAAACGGSADAAMRPACALECLHTYTLIHDDLPAMDDDDLRRGRPTAHVAFGEATAILSGDALLTFAFELLGGAVPPAPYGPGDLVAELARSAGSRGVGGGQFEDLAAEKHEPDADLLDYIHYHKTAILIRAACRMGAIAAGADPARLEALSAYGRALGLAFQIADDVLDATSTREAMGKNTQRDEEHGKLTSVRIHGVEGSRQRAQELVDAAIAALEIFDERAEPLRSLARFVVERAR